MLCVLVDASLMELGENVYRVYEVRDQESEDFMMFDTTYPREVLHDYLTEQEFKETIEAINVLYRPAADLQLSFHNSYNKSPLLKLLNLETVLVL